MPTVQVTAPSRLHFGLYSFGRHTQRDYGGVGVMVSRPRLRLHIESARSVQCLGPYADRTNEFSQTWHRFYQRSFTGMTLRVSDAAPEHAGLGLGTALGMSVAAGLRSYYDLPPASAEEMAQSVGRGARSAVGAHGFVHGGLIAEAGRGKEEALSSLEQRVALPEAWRFLLLRPTAAAGLSGEREKDAFAQLPPVSDQRRQQLIEVAHQCILPAAQSADFEQFAEAVHHFGRLAGECFAPLQGGPYNGPVVEALVETVLKLGHQGVGQSSWGPTLFVVQSDEESAEELKTRLALEVSGVEAQIAEVCNSGAQMKAVRQQ